MSIWPTTTYRIEPQRQHSAAVYRHAIVDVLVIARSLARAASVRPLLSSPLLSSLSAGVYTLGSIRFDSIRFYSTRSPADAEPQLRDQHDATRRRIRIRVRIRVRVPKTDDRLRRQSWRAVALFRPIDATLRPGTRRGARFYIDASHPSTRAPTRLGSAVPPLLEPGLDRR